MAPVLMIKLQSFQRRFMVVIVAPPSPRGSGAILGVLALTGILIRNLVILVMQIEELRGEGIDRWTAVVASPASSLSPTSPVLITDRTHLAR